MRSPKWDGIVHLVAMGRLSAQKDPGFLIATLDRLDPAVRRRIQVTWIGGGDKSMQSRLEEAGVVVTGWVNHSVATSYLQQADLYFHCAKWEGFPMTIIEAAHLGCPMLIRDVPSFEKFDFPTDAMFSDPGEAASRIADYALQPGEESAASRLSDQVRRIFTNEAQAAALESIYQRHELRSIEASPDLLRQEI